MDPYDFDLDDEAAEQQRRAKLAATAAKLKSKKVRDFDFFA